MVQPHIIVKITGYSDIPPVVTVLAVPKGVALSGEPCMDLLLHAGIEGPSDQVCIFSQSRNGMEQASHAFEQCLRFVPNMPMCLIGVGRIYSKGAKEAYYQTLRQWGVHENGTMSSPRLLLL